MSLLKLSGNTKLQIRFVAWLTAFFIVIVLIFHVGIVDAASSDNSDQIESVNYNNSDYSISRSNISLVDKFGNGEIITGVYNYTDSPFEKIKSDYQAYEAGPYHFFSSSDSDYNAVVSILANCQLPQSFTIGSNSYNLDNYKHFIAFNIGNSTYVAVCSESSKFYGKYMVSTSTGNIGNHGLFCDEVCPVFTLNSSGGVTNISLSGNLSDVVFSNGYPENMTGGNPYPRATRNVSSFGSGELLLSDSSVFSQRWYYDETSDFNGGIKILLNSVDTDITYDPFGSDNTSSGESDLNNLFLNNAHWTFNIPKGNNSSGFPNSFFDNGKAVFSGLLNSYQSSHLDNFYFHYTFYIQPQYQTGTGSGDSGGGGHPISILDAFRQNAITNNDTFFPPVFQFNLDGQTYYNQTMREFNSSGQSCTFFTYDYLWNNCFYNGISFKEYVDSWHFSNMTNCYLYCTAVMFSTGGGISGTCQAWYDLVTGQSGVTSENMTINPDPYNPITTNPQNNSNTGQYGNIIINNNNNNNVGGTPVGYTPTQAEQSKFWDIFNPLRFLGDKLFGSHTAYSSDLQEQFGINRYLPLLSQNLSSFVPFFTLAAKFFGIALGIMLVAFIIRIVLDLL